MMAPGVFPENMKKMEREIYSLKSKFGEKVEFTAWHQVKGWSTSLWSSYSFCVFPLWAFHFLETRKKKDVLTLWRCAHYVFASKIQWKPFWLSTPQSTIDLTGWQDGVNKDVCALPHCTRFHCHHRRKPSIPIHHMPWTAHASTIAACRHFVGTARFLSIPTCTFSVTKIGTVGSSCARSELVRDDGWRKRACLVPERRR